MTEILKLDESGLDGHQESVLKRVISCLEEGGIIAFPTETVYGLGVRGDSPRAVEALYALKGRSERKPLARYVCNLVQARHSAGGKLPRSAERLARALWPGPLTLVVDGPDPEQPTVGLRCPADAFSPALARRAPFPFVGTSANRSGDAELTTAESVAKEFPEGIDLIVDGGPSRFGTPSTVLRIFADEHYEILREGAINLETIADELATRTLFVCTGNTCRSPMAAAMYTDRLVQEQGDSRAAGRVYSAGLSAWGDSPASEGALEVMHERGLDLSGHRSRPVTAELLMRMDRVYVMTQAHADALNERFPHAASLVRLLDPSGDIADPFGGGLDIYRQASDQIAAAVAALELPK